MRVRVRFPAAWALPLLATLLHPGEASGCTLRKEWLTRPNTYLLGTTLADTVLAGPGRLSYSAEWGDSTAHTRPVYGQLVRLEAVRGRVPPGMARRAPARRVEAVLVPWSYGADCRTARWSGSARWREAGTRGLFAAALRPERDWVGGRPTFDVGLAGSEPYPAARFDGGVAPDTVLSADELFALYGVLPTGEEVTRDPYAAVAPLLRWAKANPRLARRYPARDALREAYEALQPCRADVDASPVAGTYRLSVTLEGADSLELFIRTSARPVGPWCRQEAREGEFTRLAPRRADGYSVYVHAAGEEGALAQAIQEGSRTGCSHGALTLQSAAREVRAGVREWGARLDWEMIARCFPSVRMPERSPRGADPGTFRMEPDGTVTFEQTLRSWGRVVGSIRGTRVSPQTLK